MVEEKKKRKVSVHLEVKIKQMCDKKKNNDKKKCKKKCNKQNFLQCILQNHSPVPPKQNVDLRKERGGLLRMSKA